MRKPSHVNSVFRLKELNSGFRLKEINSGFRPKVLKCPLLREGIFLKEKRMLVELGVAAYIASYLILEEEEQYEEDEFDDAD